MYTHTHTECIHSLLDAPHILIYISVHVHTRMHCIVCAHMATQSHKHSYTSAGTSTYMRTSVHNTLCIADTHTCCLLASHERIRGMAPCHERRKVQSAETKGCVYEEHLGSQGLEAQDDWRGKSGWYFEFRCSRRGDSMTRVPYTRLPSLCPHNVPRDELLALSALEPLSF